MAMCVMAVVGVAPCQCLWPGGHQITSPARISTMGSPSHCVQPQPDVTIKVCPSGWVCHALRAPGSKVTLAQDTRDSAGGAFNGSIRTLPVNHSAGPLIEGCDPGRLSSILSALIGHQIASCRSLIHLTIAGSRWEKKLLWPVSSCAMRVTSDAS